jgi:hypothetical protein
MKTELEEAAERLYPEDEQWTDRHIFNLGAKWQQEQDKNKYSKEVEYLKNCILHEIRNGFLLSLSAEIQIAEMEGKDVEEIYNAYKMFAYNLEGDIEKAIITFKNK